jgi:hypothetical protein
VELYLHSFNIPSWRDAQLKLRDRFTFYKHRFENCFKQTSQIIVRCRPVFYEHILSRDSSVRKVTGYGLDDQDSILGRARAFLFD